MNEFNNLGLDLFDSTSPSTINLEILENQIKSNQNFIHYVTEVREIHNQFIQFEIVKIVGIGIVISLLLVLIFKGIIKW